MSAAPLPALVLLCSSSAWGGLEQSVANLGRWLAAESINVHILCCPGTPLFEQATRQRQTVAWQKQGKYFDFAAAYRLKVQLAAWGNPPLVIPHNRDLDVAAWAHRLTGGRFALWYWQHMQLGLAKKGLFQRMRYARLTGWLTPLPWLRQEVIEKTTMPPSKVHIVPAGVELERFSDYALSKTQARESLGLPQDVTLLGLIGRLDPRKGQLLAIQAFSHLPLTIHLALMGEATRDSGQDYGAELQEAVTQAGLGDRVHFLPFSPNTPAFYHAVDVVLMCTDGETYGLVTVEALASGSSVVGSRSGGTQDLLGQGAFGELYEPGSVARLTEAIQKVLTDLNAYQAKAQDGQAYLRREASHRVVVERFKNLVLNS